MLQEANGSKRQELLQHANADQVNAVSELVLNLLKNKIPVTPPILTKLRPYKKKKKLAESPWGKGKGKGKGKGPAREVERLKPLPGWEDWAQGKKLRRRLDYEDSD